MTRQYDADNAANRQAKTMIAILAANHTEMVNAAKEGKMATLKPSKSKAHEENQSIVDAFDLQVEVNATLVHQTTTRDRKKLSDTLATWPTKNFDLYYYALRLYLGYELTSDGDGTTIPNLNQLGQKIILQAVKTLRAAKDGFPDQWEAVSDQVLNELGLGHDSDATPAKKKVKMTTAADESDDTESITPKKPKTKTKAKAPVVKPEPVDEATEPLDENEEVVEDKEGVQDGEVVEETPSTGTTAPVVDTTTPVVPAPVEDEGMSFEDF